LNDKILSDIRSKFNEWSNQGYRVLGVASKIVDSKGVYHVEDEKEMIFDGFLLFFDPPKEDAANTIRNLADLGVTLKIITGDNRLVANHIASRVGLDVDLIITGSELNSMSGEALMQIADKADILPR